MADQRIFGRLAAEWVLFCEIDNIDVHFRVEIWTYSESQKVGDKYESDTPH